MIRIGIIGVTGYTGIELLRLLQQHPHAVITAVFTESYSGQDIAAVYPHLTGLVQLTGEKLDLTSIAQRCDLIFVSLPHSHAIGIAQSLLDAGVKIIDLGADFRLKNGATYQHYYQQTPAPDTLLSQAVYGLPENCNKDQIAQASLVANPGCYPTACLLASLPALRANIVSHHDCIFDAKSGISGAGRGLALTSHFCEVSENLVPYQIAGQHRHTPEIEQELSLITQTPMIVQFTPQLAPIIRGLLATVYFKLNNLLSVADIHAIYQQHYKDALFIRVCPLGKVAQVKQVRGTNYCDISVHVDPRTQRLIVVSVIDNLIKGAAGQAIQNMNLLYQLPEATGLQNIYATYP